MGNVNEKLWEAVERNDLKGLEEVLRQKDVNVDTRKEFILSKKDLIEDNGFVSLNQHNDYPFPYHYNYPGKPKPTNNDPSITSSTASSSTPTGNGNGDAVIPSSSVIAYEEHKHPHVEAFKNQVEDVKNLFGSAVNKDIFTPLHYACKNGHREIVQMLIRCKADIHAKATHERYGRQAKLVFQQIRSSQAKRQAVLNSAAVDFQRLELKDNETASLHLSDPGVQLGHSTMISGGTSPVRPGVVGLAGSISLSKRPAKHKEDGGRDKDKKDKKERKERKEREKDKHREGKEKFIKYVQYTPLFYACQNRHVGIVLDVLFAMLDGWQGAADDSVFKRRVRDIFIQKSDTITTMLVAHNGDLNVCVDALIALGGRVDGQACVSLERDVLEAKPLNWDLTKADTPEPAARPLFHAVSRGNMEAVRLLVQNYGAAITPVDLEEALARKFTDIWRYLDDMLNEQARRNGRIRQAPQLTHSAAYVAQTSTSPHSPHFSHMPQSPQIGGAFPSQPPVELNKLVHQTLQSQLQTPLQPAAIAAAGNPVGNASSSLLTPATAAPAVPPRPVSPGPATTPPSSPPSTEATVTPGAAANSGAPANAVSLNSPIGSDISSGQGSGGGSGGYANNDKPPSVTSVDQLYATGEDPSPLKPLRPLPVQTPIPIASPQPGQGHYQPQGPTQSPIAQIIPAMQPLQPQPHHNPFVTAGAYGMAAPGRGPLLYPQAPPLAVPGVAPGGIGAGGALYPGMPDKRLMPMPYGQPYGPQSPYAAVHNVMAAPYGVRPPMMGLAPPVQQGGQASAPTAAVMLQPASFIPSAASTPVMPAPGHSPIPPQAGQPPVSPFNPMAQSGDLRYGHYAQTPVALRPGQMAVSTPVGQISGQPGQSPMPLQSPQGQQMAHSMPTPTSATSLYWQDQVQQQQKKIQELQEQLQKQQQEASSSSAQSSSPSTSGSVTLDDSAYAIEYSELEFDREIARGSFGIVYAGKFRGTDVAIKKLIHQNLNQKELDEFNSEVNVMKKLHHPNVLLLMGVCNRPPNMCMVTELMSTSMWDLLHKQKLVRLDWKIVLRFITDTAKGMNYLHLFKPPVLHRDLKTPNLLVDKDFNVKIADFGLARLKAHVMTGNLGTCQYMAPEVIRSENYTESADVYSFGIIMWEIITRQPPFHGMQAMQIAYSVTSGVRPPVPPTCPPALSVLMQQCWHQDPAQRPSFAVILSQLKGIHF